MGNIQKNPKIMKSYVNQIIQFFMFINRNWEDYMDLNICLKDIQLGNFGRIFIQPAKYIASNINKPKKTEYSLIDELI